jgi:hypothetical protein
VRTKWKSTLIQDNHYLTSEEQAEMVLFINNNLEKEMV